MYSFRYCVSWQLIGPSWGQLLTEKTQAGNSVGVDGNASTYPSYVYHSQWEYGGVGLPVASVPAAWHGIPHVCTHC